MEEIIKNVSDTITDKTVTISVDIKPNSAFHAFLQRLKVMPSKRLFRVNGLRWGSLLRISAITANMKETLNDLLNDAQGKIITYGPDVVDVVAIGLHNKKSNPPESLKQFILDNMTAAEITDVMSVILNKMNVAGFISTIVLIKGLNVMETSQDQQGSSIALGEQLEALSSTSG
ncbi:MAG: hypothetical protein J7527_15750 [Chitinophagaceae bacterium]|nr:hypothetical protein [Chitinophagaceae bacterium]